MESKPKEELIRITWFEDRLELDPTGKAKGRGVYLCRNVDCVEKAMRRGAFTRSLHADPGRQQIEQVLEKIRVAGAAGPEGEDHAE